MKKSDVVLGLGLLLAIGVAVGAVAFATLGARNQAQSMAQMNAVNAQNLQRSRDLEKSIANLKAELIAAKLLGEERGRELSNLRNQNAELEKQVASLKSNPLPGGRARIWNRGNTDPNVQPNMIFGINGQAVQLGGEIPPEVQQQLNNTVHLRPGLNGIITINGETIKVLGDNIEAEDNIQIQLNGVPPQQPKAPPTEKKKSEKLDEQF